jgi:hypothetical protein
MSPIDVIQEDCSVTDHFVVQQGNLGEGHRVGLESSVGLISVPVPAALDPVALKGNDVDTAQEDSLHIAEGSEGIATTPSINSPTLKVFGIQNSSTVSTEDGTSKDGLTPQNLAAPPTPEALPT